MEKLKEQPKLQSQTQKKFTIKAKENSIQSMTYTIFLKLTGKSNSLKMVQVQKVIVFMFRHCLNKITRFQNPM